MRYLPYYWLLGLFFRGNIFIASVDVHVTSSELEELLEFEKRLLRCSDDILGEAQVELEDILQFGAPTGI